MDPLRTLATLALGAALAGCGASDSDCIVGAPCGPTPSFAEPVPVPVATSARFDAIGLGNWHSCMLDTAGAAWCWGINEYDQLGADSAQRCVSDLVDCSSVPLRVKGGHVFAGLAAGQLQTCALTPAGAAWCWGHGNHLATGTSTGSRTPVPVAGGRVFVALAVGTQHNCALTADGQAWCWGQGSSAGDGNASGNDRPIPVAVAGGLRFTRISAGQERTCGLASDGSAWCWGQGYNGVLGDGSGAQRIVPTAVAYGGQFVDIAAGGQSTCGIASDGTTWCWGGNERGTVGVPVVGR